MAIWLADMPRPASYLSTYLLHGNWEGRAFWGYTDQNHFCQILKMINLDDPAFSLPDALNIGHPKSGLH
jgi:hypothetical protein